MTEISKITGNVEKTNFSIPTDNTKRIPIKEINVFDKSGQTNTLTKIGKAPKVSEGWVMPRCSGSDIVYPKILSDIPRDYKITDV